MKSEIFLFFSFLLFRFRRCQSEAPKKNFDDFLELESDASEVESWLDNSMYQKCGDVPEEDDMGRERGNVFSLSPSFFYIFDTSLETISPLGFTSGGRQKKMMRFDSKKGRIVLAHPEDEQDLDDPMTSSKRVVSCGGIRFVSMVTL